MHCNLCLYSQSLLIQQELVSDDLWCYAAGRRKPYAPSFEGH